MIGVLKRKLLSPAEKKKVKVRLRRMFRASKRELELSQDRNLSLEKRKAYFQQACEKLYKAASYSGA